MSPRVRDRRDVMHYIRGQIFPEIIFSFLAPEFSVSTTGINKICETEQLTNLQIFHMLNTQLAATITKNEIMFNDLFRL